MKRKGYKNSYFSFSGAIIFFATIAIVMQSAILIYDYIIKRTDDKGLIAFLILAVVIILSAVCTVIDIIRRKIMIDRPVEKILAATEKIASGDFSVRIETSHVYGKYDEYDLIAENLNILAAELAKSEFLKNDFISNVSHELKTPLAVIQSYATAIRSEKADRETKEKYIDIILAATTRLNALVTNILKLNKLENQEIIPEFERINLTEMLSESVLAYEEQIEKKDISLDCDFDDVIIYSAPAYLEIVWNNLISNAIKFTDNGEIRISLREKNGKATVEVSDTGCGISPEVGKKIFEKFYQADTSHSGEGNGLGLALVKRVIDILGGEISVISEPSRGSTFTITLEGVMYE